MAIEERIQQPKQRRAISAAKRARLEETFKRASKKATTLQDFDFSTELLAQCVLGNPGNPTYVRAYFENLQKKFQSTKGSQLGWFKDRAAHSGLKKALAQGQWDEAIRHGLQVLRVNPWDVPTLTQMATAAKESGDSDSELCYLKVALTKLPKDPTCNRMAAIALDEMGLVNQAIVFWERVLEALPKDKQAKEAISAFQVGAKAQGAARRRGPTVEEQEELVRQREIQQQEEKARQQKIREEEEATRKQRMEEQAAIEPENVATNLEPLQAESNDILAEKARMVGVSENADSAYKEGYDYGVEEMPEVASKRTRENLLTLVVMLITWLVVLGFVVVKWGPIIWKRFGGAWWAWIVLGMVLLIAAMVLHSQQRR